MPSTDGSSSRGRPSRRATISAREGSPSRAGSVADISTPIAVPCIASARRGRDARQRGAQDRVPGDRAQHHRGAHQRDRQQHPRGARGEHGRGDGVPADALHGEPCAARRGERGADERDPAPQPRGAREAARPRLERRQPARRPARPSGGGAQAVAHREARGRARRLRHRERVLVGLDHARGDARPRVALGRPAGALAEALEPRPGRARARAASRPGRARRPAAPAGRRRRARRRRGSRGCPTPPRAFRPRTPRSAPSRTTPRRATARRARARGRARRASRRRRRGRARARRAGRRATAPAPPASTPITDSRAGWCSRSASNARSSTGSPLRSTAWPTNAISSGSPGARRRGAGAPPAGSVTPLGTIRYSPPKKRRPVHSAASDTAIRTRRRFMLRLDPHSHATACGRTWWEYVW